MGFFLKNVVRFSLLIVLVSSVDASHFITVGAGQNIEGLYYESGGEMVPVNVEKGRYSPPYEMPLGAKQLDFFRRLQHQGGEPVWTLVTSAELKGEAGLYVLLFHAPARDSDQYQVVVYSQDLTEGNNARVVFLNLSPNPVAMAFNQERLVLTPGKIEVLAVEVKKQSNAVVQEVRLAFYLKPEWQLFYSTRWALSADSTRLVFTQSNDRKQMEVDYIDLGMSALRQYIKQDKDSSD